MQKQNTGLRFSNGCHYRGELKHGLFEGSASITYPSLLLHPNENESSRKSAMFQGAFRHGFATGLCSLHLEETPVQTCFARIQDQDADVFPESVVSGRFKQGFLQGYGALRLCKGVTYEGHFKNHAVSFLLILGCLCTSPIVYVL